MKRFIRYLYEYEGNQKKRNVGFVKVEQDGKETTISVHGKGLCGKSNENISCYLIKLDSETGNILFVPAGEIQMGMFLLYRRTDKSWLWKDRAECRSDV